MLLLQPAAANMILKPPSCLLILALIILNLLVAHEAAAALLTNETDYQALLSFKNHIVSDPFNVFHSWNDSVNFCGWTGVTCGKKHHRVTRLSLPELQLAGPLSSSIGNLSFLRLLNLNDNSFNGILPPEMSNLFRLVRLGLANNSFGGEFPKNVSHFRALSILHVYGNHLEGKIPVEFGTLPKINILVLGGNRFTGNIPPSFGNLSTLNYLFLSYNDLHGDIPRELGRLHNLTNLLLSANHLSGSVPTALFNMSSLVVLAAVQNNLTGILPPDIFLTLPNLHELYLGLNSFSGSIPSSISNASNLVVIDISTNNLVGSVPVNFGTSCNTLEVLNFQRNRLGTEGGDDFRFITSLTNYTKLRRLSVSVNILKGVLPNSVVNLPSTLRTLDLRENDLSGTIPEGIGNLVNLRGFDVQFNQLSGKLPDDLGKLSNLNTLNVFGNNITGSIPSSLGNLTSLTYLYLGTNTFEGTIPASLGNCTSLLGLDLSENQLDGPIPQQLLALSSLTISLDLYGNNLTGPMPSQVGKLVHLLSLDVSKNNMYGEIPASLGNCLMLEALQLQRNNFSGSIPSPLKNLRSMKLLDLSQNNLSGQIPSFLVGMPLLEYLNLSFNMFEGEVPNGGIFNNRSAVSLVGNLKLCGGPSIWEFPPCSQPKKQGRRFLHQSVVVAISATTAASLLCVCLTIAVLYMSRKSRHQTTTSSTEAPYPRLSYGDLFQATNGFSNSNILGEGSFGVVYKGVLRSNEEGQIIAVKVLKLEQERGAIKSFMAECEALRNIRHRNLVKTITSCSSIDFAGNEFKALVFEFIPNGSLEKWLHPYETEGTSTTPRLSLLERLNIAIDIAASLNYLHHLCHTPIIHCDLKSSNVLLDSDMSARLSDFGLAKFLIAKISQSHSQTSSIGIRGTLGYIAPEYGLGGGVSTRGDVYSFGILLLEMFTGKRPTDSMFADNFGLRKYVAKAVADEEGLLAEVVDPALLYCEEEANPRRYKATLYKCLTVVLQLGITCSAALPTARIDIGDVVLELNKARELYLNGTENRRRPQ